MQIRAVKVHANEGLVVPEVVLLLRVTTLCFDCYKLKVLTKASEQS